MVFEWIMGNFFPMMVMGLFVVFWLSFGLLLVVALLGWYMCFIIMAGEMRITLNLPVGDLSHFWPRTDVELAAAEHRD